MPKEYKVYLEVTYTGSVKNRKELNKAITKLKKLPTTFDATMFGFKRGKVELYGWDEGDSNDKKKT